MSSELNVVTGAFSHTGKYIAKLLHSMEKEVRTLTSRSSNDNPFDFEIQVFPFNFENPNELRKSLEGATTLYNTYWIRFPYGKMTFEKAVENSKKLIKATEEAGIKRIVHLSITNPSEDSSFPYFRGKALVEKAVKESNLSYAIIRNDELVPRHQAHILKKYISNSELIEIEGADHAFTNPEKLNEVFNYISDWFKKYW